MDNNITLCVNGELRPGDMVLSLKNSDYSLLVGEVFEITKPGNPEHDTDNETDDIHVNFTAFDYFDIRKKEILDDFITMYDQPMSFDEITLDDVIMAPEMLVSIKDISRDDLDFILDSEENAEAYCDKIITEQGGISGKTERNQPEHERVPPMFINSAELSDFIDNTEAISEHTLTHGFSVNAVDSLLLFARESAAKNTYDWPENAAAARNLAVYIARNAEYSDPGSKYGSWISVFNAAVKNARALPDEILPKSRGFKESGIRGLAWFACELANQHDEKLSRHIDGIQRLMSRMSDFWGLDQSLCGELNTIINEAVNAVPAQARMVGNDSDVLGSGQSLTPLEKLTERLGGNFAEFFNTIRGLDNKSIAGRLMEIASAAEAYHYLTKSHSFETSELEYLLKFQNPLKVVADEFEAGGPVDRSLEMWKIFDHEDALQGGYSLVSNDVNIETSENREAEQAFIGRMESILKDVDPDHLHNIILYARDICENDEPDISVHEILTNIFNELDSLAQSYGQDTAGKVTELFGSGGLSHFELRQAAQLLYDGQSMEKVAAMAENGELMRIKSNRQLGFHNDREAAGNRTPPQNQDQAGYPSVLDRIHKDKENKRSSPPSQDGVSKHKIKRNNEEL